MPSEPITYLAGRVCVLAGDLTEQAVDAIVNAANSSWLGGGGVDGAIHRHGGPAILQACRNLRTSLWPNGLPAGQAVITTGGDLPARYVIHTVGPIYGRHGGHEAELLADCYRNALALAAGHGLRRLAIPAIATGIYGYPADEAARIVSLTLCETLPKHPEIEEIRLVFFSDEQRDIFLAHQCFAGNCR